MRQHWQQLNKKERYVVIGSLILAILVLSHFIFFQDDNKNAKNESVNTPVENTKEKETSRITFFHVSRPICSLAIPSDWEGRYRVRDKGEEAVFEYIDNGNSKEFFSIKKTNENNGNEILLNKNGKNYLFKLSTTIEKKETVISDFKEMIDDIETVKKSFKCF